jgi:D-alanyl-D-alanine carboxypeptidase
MLTRVMIASISLAFCVNQAWAQDRQAGERIDAYLKPYVSSGNFSGAVLIKRHGRVVFERSHGFADREHRIPNTTATRFHIASASMQFTAAAVLRLVDEGSLSLETHVGEFVPGIAGAEKITVRDLLAERSGLPDINDRADYDEILRHHQTPASLVAAIEGSSLLFEPGSKFLHEEHSAYNLLALIVEKKTGVPFAAAVDHLVFRPARLRASGVDDDSTHGAAKMAYGYEPEGVKGLKRAAEIQWSAKTGNASVYTTTGDEAAWMDELFAGHLLSASSREAVLATSERIGFGWFKGASKRFSETTYYMNGRSPGFASFVLYLPREQTSIVVFSNIYSSATTTIGNDIAAIVLGLPYETFHPSDPAPSPSELKTCEATFKFGPDFYQPNAEITLLANEAELSLRWPSAAISPLIPVGRDHFVDRSYWEHVKIGRDGKGHAMVLDYGSFRGSAIHTEQGAFPDCCPFRAGRHTSSGVS